jgi:hypothetical protein
MLEHWLDDEPLELDVLDDDELLPPPNPGMLGNFGVGVVVVEISSPSPATVA